MSLASDIDDRTVKQQLEDLGVEVIRPKKEVVGVKWTVKKNRATTKKSKFPYMQMADRCITFNTSARGLLKNFEPEFRFGVGIYEGKNVVLLKEDSDGYRISITRAKNGKAYGGRTGASGLIAWLHEQGIENGRYELVVVKGGWMGVPMSEDVTP